MILMQAAPKPAPRPVSKTQKVAAPARESPAVRLNVPKTTTLTRPTLSHPTAERKGGAGYRKYSGDALWLPNATRPDWLDGSLPGDRGFDPLGLAKPVEYLQYDVDSLDQNLAVNKKGNLIGTFKPDVDQVSENRLSPYSEVFGLQRFRCVPGLHSPPGATS